MNSKACTDQWYLDQGGRMVSAGPNMLCFQVAQNLHGFTDNRWYLDLVSCSQQDDDPVSKQIFHINNLGHLRNAKLDAENLNVCLKIPDNTTEPYPVFVDCGDSFFFRAEIAWYFDGGDCQFNQYVRNMYSPLQWILEFQILDFKIL